MNEQELNNEEEIIEGETEDFPVNDKRRFNEDGERINVEVEEDTERKESKSPEVIRLENELDAARTRCEVAETKLVDVQKTF